VSYELYLLRKDEDDPGGPLAQREGTVRREIGGDEEDELRLLAADLQAIAPDLHVSESTTGFALRLAGEHERPVTIDIDATSITLSWSYDSDPDAALAAAELFLPVLERHGYVAFDPQLGRVYEPFWDRSDAARIHREVRERHTDPLAPREDRPLWRRLLGTR
jgi:hypothetical protein